MNGQLNWDKLPTHWGEGAFLGNGLLGVIIYSNDSHSLTWELGRTDIYDKQIYNPVDTDRSRVPLGRYVMQIPGKIQSFEMIQDIQQATVKGTIITDAEVINFSSYIHAVEPIIVIETNKPVTYKYIVDYPLAPFLSYTKEFFKFDELPEPSEFQWMDGIMIREQKLKIGGSFVVAYKHENTLTHLTVSHGPKASQLAYNTLSKPFFYEDHISWWKAYWERTSISLPDKRLEAFYNLQIYKIGSAARDNQPMMDLMGPWLYKTCWAGMWWNLNTQLAYWPVYTGNRLELGKPLFTTLIQNLDTLIENAGEYKDDSAMIGRATGRELKSLTNTELCNLPWLCHNCWLQYRYSMDSAMLPLLFELIKRSTNYYLHHTEFISGHIHIKESVSPEYHKTARNTNMNLFLLSWCCERLIEISSLLGLEPDSKWQFTLDHLSDYPTNKNGFMIGTDVPFDTSHRHFSHLLGIYPLYLINKENFDVALMKRSIDHWIGLDESLTGYSFTSAASLYAAIGEGEKAYHYINRFLDEVPTYNSMYLEHLSWGGGGHTLETPLTVASTIHDMLLQSWGGKIRVFPAVPNSWSQIAFTHFRAEGGFLVSAQRKNNTDRVEITSNVSCKVTICAKNKDYTIYVTEHEPFVLEV